MQIIKTSKINECLSVKMVDIVFINKIIRAFFDLNPNYRITPFF